MLLCSTNSSLDTASSISNNTFKTLSEKADWDLHLKCLSSNPFHLSFSKSNNSSNKIPRIFHQTYKDLEIPAKYAYPLGSLGAHHNIGSRLSASGATSRGREYEYVFWSDLSIMEFIASYYPDYVALFEGYTHPLERADAIRYFIMYEFGGIYANFDMEVRRPLDSLIERGYSCILGEEPPIQTKWLYDINRSVFNALMLCAPRHPFFRLVIDSLREFQQSVRSSRDTITFKTGPYFLQQVVARYMQADAQRTLQCARDPLCRSDCLLLAAPQVFFPVVDSFSAQHLQNDCIYFLRQFVPTTTSATWMRAKRSPPPELVPTVDWCVWWFWNDFRLATIEESFTSHLYYHLGYQAFNGTTVHLGEFIPKVNVFTSGSGGRGRGTTGRDEGRPWSLVHSEQYTTKPKPSLL